MKTFKCLSSLLLHQNIVLCTSSTWAIEITVNPTVHLVASSANLELFVEIQSLRNRIGSLQYWMKLKYVKNENNHYLDFFGLLYPPPASLCVSILSAWRFVWLESESFSWSLSQTVLVKLGQLLIILWPAPQTFYSSTLYDFSNLGIFMLYYFSH